MTIDDLNALETKYVPVYEPGICGVFALAREGLARREGATAYQALCSRLWREGYAVDLAYQGHFTARIICGLTRRVYESEGRHETETAAVLAAVAKREASNG